MDDVIGGCGDCGQVTYLVVTGDPLDQLITLETTFTLTATATSSPNYTVYWQQSGDSGSSWSNILGATSANFTGGPLNVEDSGYQYRAVFSNGLIAANTDAATVVTATSIDDLIAGKIAATSQQLVSAFDPVTLYPNTRNINNWATDLDLSCIALWNSESGGSKSGVLISPLHVLFSNHWKPGVGATLVFLSMNNERVIRTISQITPAPGYTPFYPDYAVAKLNQPVPLSIGNAWFLPDGEVFPDVMVNNFPIIWKNQFNELCVSEIYEFGAKFVKYKVPTTGQRAAFGKTVILYDSGGPSFIVIDNKLVLLSVMTGGNGGSGTNLTLQLQDIKDIMIAQGDEYTIQTIQFLAPSTL